MKSDGSSKALMLVISGLTLVGLCALLLIYLRGGEAPPRDEATVEQRAATRPRPVGPTRPRSTRSQTPPAPSAAARNPAPARQTAPGTRPAPAAPPREPPPSTALAPTPFGSDPGAAAKQEPFKDRIERLARELAEARRNNSLSRERYEYKAHELKELKEVVAREEKMRAEGRPVNR